MQRVYVEQIRASLTVDDDIRQATVQEHLRETFERAMSRAGPEFNAPTRAVSVSVLSVGLDQHLVVLVEETEAGFRPLGT